MCLFAPTTHTDTSQILPHTQQYGDHLYEEKDFDGSIAQYSHTVGYIPSSSVIT